VSDGGAGAVPPAPPRTSAMDAYDALIGQPFRLVTRHRAARPGAYGERQRRVLDAAGLARARREIGSWPGYAPTPLRSLPGLARAAGVAAIEYKDEGERFGLASFKPLGGAYAVYEVIAEEVERRSGRRPASRALLAGEQRPIAAAVTVCAATDGNHGRAVAWGARMFGCRAVIFIHETVTAARERAIAGLGAEVRRVPGGFDDAVRAAAETAAAEGWTVVPDTAAGSEREVPRRVMQGYALMAEEAIEQGEGRPPPTHLFLQAGVGGMAAATCARFWERLGEGRPRTVLVEPEQAACWLESLAAGRPVTVAGDLDSLMAGLACGEPSPLAWEILADGADAAMAIPDAAAEEAMRLLAAGLGTDPPLVGGESGVAGLAAALIAAANPAARARLGIDPGSRILVFGTEGATDPASYRRIVGRPAEEVAAAGGTEDGR